NLAKAAYLHFASVANQGRFIMTRDDLRSGEKSGAEKKALEDLINAVLDSEMDLAKELFRLTRKDSRIGYEATNQYYYVAQDLIEKVINCEYVRDKMVK